MKLRISLNRTVIFSANVHFFVFQNWFYLKSITYFCLVSGCCFVTFFTRKAALHAQDALHNVKTLNGVSSNNLMNPFVLAFVATLLSRFVFSSLKGNSTLEKNVEGYTEPSTELHVNRLGVVVTAWFNDSALGWIHCLESVF